MKKEKKKKIKFSVELMQREEFCKILLDDEIISTLLAQIKEIFSSTKNSEINRWLLELDENYDHKNEMSRFIEYVNDKLSYNNKTNDNDNNNYYLEDLKNSRDKKENEEPVYKKEIEEIKTKIKKKKNKNKINKPEEKIDELKFKDIDEILNYINEETDSKKGKKKCKKQKKNKKKKEDEKENQTNEEQNNYKIDNDSLRFEKEFENFKEDLTKDTMYIYEINNKIKPCLSENFLNNIAII